MPYPVRLLGDLCYILDSRRRPVTKKDRVSGEYPYYGATGLLDYVDSYIFDEQLVLVGEDGAKWEAGERTSFAVSGKCWINNHAHVLRPNRELITDKWLIHYLNATDLSLFVTGLTVPKLNQARLREIPMPLPPLIEQTQIVAILDEAFEGIDKAIANTQKNLEGVRELYVSFLSSLFTAHQEEWIEYRLGDVVTRLTNGYVGPTRNIYHRSGVPYLLARHVKNNFLIFDSKTFISEEFNSIHRKSMLKTGDVLLVQSGHIGHSAVVPAEHNGHNCHAMIVITPVKERLTGKFLSLHFSSARMQKRFGEIRSGSTVPHLTCKGVKELAIQLPGLPIQQRIVDQAEDMQAETQQLEAFYREELQILAHLKRSILAKAFAGELTERSVEAVQEAAA